MFNDCIIMAGGSGTRLWPASNSKTPKQFLSITGPRGREKDAPETADPAAESFFSSALKRALSVIEGDDGRVIIIAGKSHVPRIIGTCAAFSEAERKHMILIPEPEAKNTAPAIACGTVYASLAGAGERNILVITSDHIISPMETFTADARAASNFARRDKLAVFGIPPSRPETGYGYIETGERVSDAPGEEVFAVSSFREKPDRKTAEEFLTAGRFFWNSGMFAFPSAFMLEEYRRRAPSVIAPFGILKAPGEESYTVEKGLRVLGNWRDLEKAYAETEGISFDFAIAEKCAQTVMVKSHFNWLDIGNWDEYAKLLGDTGSEVYRSGAETCFVDSDIPVALAGVEDLIVTVRSQGGAPVVMIVKKGETQRVREIVEQIRAAGRTDLL